MVSVERRDLALEVGRFGRAASLYNLLSHCDAFGLCEGRGPALIDGMLAVVRGWREFFIRRGVEQRVSRCSSRRCCRSAFSDRSHLRLCEG